MKNQRKHQKLHLIKSSLSDPCSIYLSTLAVSGRRAVRAQLLRVIELLNVNSTPEQYPWQQLRYEHVVRVRFLLLDQGYAVNTVNLTLSAIRGVIQSCFNMGLVDADTVMRIQAVKRVSGDVLPTGRSLNQVEIKKLFNYCRKDRTQIGKRNLALVSIMLTTGLRRNEVAQLKVQNYESRTGYLLVNNVKGRKQRITYIPQSVRCYLKGWLKTLDEVNGPLFRSILKNGRLSQKSLTAQSIYNIIKNCCKNAGLGDVSPHSLRRTYISTLLGSGVDINHVKTLVGHSSVNTTSRYDCRKSQNKKVCDSAFLFK